MSRITSEQDTLILLTATHFIPATFFLVRTMSSLCCQVLDCRAVVRSCSYSMSGLPDTPSRSTKAHSQTCWSTVRVRHVLELLLSVTAILATIVLYVQVNALLLVIIYITFILATILDVFGKPSPEFSQSVANPFLQPPIRATW